MTLVQCMCIVLCHFIKYDLCSHQCNSELFHEDVPHAAHLQILPSLLPSIIPISGNHDLPLYNFVIFRMSCKWNHIYMTLCDWLLSLSVMPEMYPRCCKYQWFLFRDFPGGAVVKNPPANAGDRGSIPGLGRSHMPRSNQTCAPQQRVALAHRNYRKPTRSSEDHCSQQ